MLRLVAGLLAVTCMDAAEADCEAARATLSQAERALSDGRPEEADRLLQPLQVKVAACPAILLLAGRVKDAEGLPSLARDFFTRYTMAAPSDPIGFVALARTMWKQRDAASALDALEHALQVDKQNVEALLLRSELHESRRETALAETDLVEAAQLAPLNGQVHFQLGTFYDRHHQAEQAIDAFRKVTVIDPANAFAWDYLALNFEAEGLNAQAEAAYRSGLKANRANRPDRFLEYNFGRFLVKENRLDESKPLLDRAVEKAPDNRAVYYERAKLKLLLRDLQGSQTDVEKALTLRDPGQYVQDVQLYALAAVVAGRLGEADKAQRYAALARINRLQSGDRGRQ